MVEPEEQFGILSNIEGKDIEQAVEMYPTYEGGCPSRRCTTYSNYAGTDIKKNECGYTYDGVRLRTRIHEQRPFPENYDQLFDDIDERSGGYPI